MTEPRMCCITCDEKYRRDHESELLWWWAASRFHVCPTCGNKRCPTATDHRLPCGGSNEPGQPGSVYQ